MAPCFYNFNSAPFGQYLRKPGRGRFLCNQQLSHWTPHTQSSKKSPQKSLRSKFVEMMLRKLWIFQAGYLIIIFVRVPFATLCQSKWWLNLFLGIKKKSERENDNHMMTSATSWKDPFHVKSGPGHTSHQACTCFAENSSTLQQRSLLGS